MCPKACVQKHTPNRSALPVYEQCPIPEDLNVHNVPREASFALERSLRNAAS